jgi:hypothetical protein
LRIELLKLKLCFYCTGFKHRIALWLAAGGGWLRGWECMSLAIWFSISTGQRQESL